MALTLAQANTIVAAALEHAANTNYQPMRSWSCAMP
jgi:hypothetical protein